MVFLFILQYLPFSFCVPQKGKNITKGSVDELALLSHKIATYTHNIIVIRLLLIMLTDTMFLCVLLLHCELHIHNTCQYMS